MTSSTRSAVAERAAQRKSRPASANLNTNDGLSHGERLFVVVADDVEARSPTSYESYRSTSPVAHGTVHVTLDDSLVPSRFSTAAKRWLDIVGTLVLALVFSPFIIPIALFIRLTGPVIYRHRRVGKNGETFDCLKFRTMVPNAEKVLADVLEEHPELKAEWIRDHKLKDDPRITVLGKFLRRTSLDELPQLWNVLRGEMSLVGPRPVVKEELLRYGRNVSVYYAAKPGVTGLWQVSGRNDMDYRRRVAIDVYYVRNRTLLLDLFILLKTTRVVLAGKGAY